MKAREIRAALQGDVDPKIIHALCTIAESLAAQQQEIMAMAEIQNKCIDLIMSLGVTIEGATNAVDAIKNIREG
jgi:hypothetical protein